MSGYIMQCVMCLTLFVSEEEAGGDAKADKGGVANF